ncbi:MAG: formylglycine-generating enzyme family protein [Planctomycetaceae bacterium]
MPSLAPIHALATVLLCGLMLAALSGCEQREQATRTEIEQGTSPPSAAEHAAASTSTGNRASGASRLLVDEPAATPAGMVWVAGGEFRMGTDAVPSPGASNPDRIKPDEYPEHPVALDGFWMKTTPVTNREFAQFVAATGYVTLAEREPTREELLRMGMHPDQITDEMFRPTSICFKENFDAANLVTGVQNWEYQVWEVREGANWRHPEGPDSSIDDRMDHPVVHVNFDDAQAYCAWAGVKLPTEAQFEYAARSGGKPVKYPWGDGLTTEGAEMCNYFQGEFPTKHLNRDGFETTSPVKSFAPNELGLYDMSGNVWEWCRDLYDATYYQRSARHNPTGPARSFDPAAAPEEANAVKRVQRGGSFMCNINNCTGYRCGARMRCEELSSSFHGGFRYVVEPEDRALFDERQSAITAEAVAASE